MQENFPKYPIRDIIPDPNQPRKHFDDTKLRELAHSISQYDVIQPILIRPVKSKNKGKFMIVSGERRWRAAQLAMLEEIPAVVRALTDIEALEVQITENLQRENVNPMEEADAFLNIIKGGIYKTKELAARLGKRKEYILQRLKLCELIPEFQDLVYADKILMTQANQICRFAPDVQMEFYHSHVPADWREMPDGWKLREITFGNTTHNLDEAPFKTEDPKLYPKMGACGQCRFNSKVSELDFEGQENKRICSNPSCYETKVHKAYEQRLQEAQGNALLIAGHSYTAITNQKIKNAREQGLSVLEYGDYEILKEPVISTKEEFLRDRPHLRLLNEAIQDSNYQVYLTDQQQKKEEYEQKKPFAQKAFVVGSDHYLNTGDYVEVYVPPAGGEEQNEAENLAAAIEEIRNSTQRKIDQSKRDYADDVKRGLFGAVAYYDNERPLEIADCIAVFAILLDATSPDTCNELRNDFGTPDITDEKLLVDILSTGRTSFLYKWIRRLLLEVLENSTCSVNSENFVRLNLAKRYLPMYLEGLQDPTTREQMIREKANEEIAALQQTKIDHPEDATGAASETPVLDKKLKGLRALIEHVKQ